MDYHKLLTLSTDLGFLLLESGAEIYRVEESVQRLLAAYGLTSGEAFVIPNCITVSLVTPDGQALTRVRRMPTHGTDIDLLERCNTLCRKLCRDRPPLDQAEAGLAAVTQSPRNYSLPVQLFGYFLGAGAFALFFGGSVLDGLCAGVCGIAIAFCLIFMTNLGTNLFFKTVAAGTLSALLALALCFFGLGQHVDLITIGALMLLVPGLIFTNAMRDIMAGDMVAGITKTAEALLIGAAIALGTGVALWLARLLWGGGV
ncbi:MAG: threonine/serine exporter family protein [Pseudoflavonifractor sp.]